MQADTPPTGIQADDSIILNEVVKIMRMKTESIENVLEKLIVNVVNEGEIKIREGGKDEARVRKETDMKDFRKCGLRMVRKRKRSGDDVKRNEGIIERSENSENALLNVRT